MANNINVTLVLLVLIGGLHLIFAEESALPLAATSTSIYYSINKKTFKELNTTLMDVINKYANFKQAYLETNGGKPFQFFVVNLVWYGYPKKLTDILARGKTFGLTDDESLAVMIYTATAVHSEFNRILREGDTSKYDTSYQVLNYLLISAIEKIRVKQTLPEYLYRGVGKIFSATQGAALRLPGYTSTSTRLSVAQSFRGAKGTLIRLRGVTFGADISGFSLYPSEAEVLIPPYESFKVTTVSTDDKGLLIDLESIGEKCGSVDTWGPCQCCRQGFNRGVPLLMHWTVLGVYPVVYVLVKN